MKRAVCLLGMMMWLPLTGCGGGGSASNDTTTTPPPVVTVDKGNLSLTMLGLPIETAPNVMVTGPNGYTKQVSSSTTLSDVEIGNYTIVPAAVAAAGITYDVVPSSYSVTVSKGQTSTLELVYQSPIVSQGIVTNFGSVYVNGIRFDTATSQFKSEAGETASESDFSVGMLVTVKGRSGANGEHAKAEQIEYDLKAKGKVVSVSLSDATVTVLGLTFIVTESTEFENTTLETLLVDDFVKVSAIKNEQDQLVATHIEKESDTSLFVLKGTIALFNSEAMTFALDNLVINYAQAEVMGTLQNEASVVVYSDQAVVNGELAATKIKVLDGLDDTSSAQYAIDGVVTSVASDSQFTVAGLLINWNSDTKLFGGVAEDLQVGVRVKVHGAKIDDQFTARKIRFDKSGVISLKGAIENIDLDAQTLTLLSTTFTLDNHTKLKDKSRFKVRRMTLSNLNVGDVISVKAFLSSQEQVLLAKQVTRLNAQGDAQTGSTEVEGKVTSIEDKLFTVRGIKVTTNEVSEFEYNDESVDSTSFFTQLKVGDKVEVKGLRQENNTLLGQEIEAKSSTDSDKPVYVKLKGTISDFESSSAFIVNGRAIKTNEYTRFEDGTPSALANGVLIEVKGSELDDGSILALKIEFEREDDKEQLEIKGAISAFTSETDFMVKSQPVTTTSATVFKNGQRSQLGLNVIIEVEGTLNTNGILVADSVKFEGDQQKVTLMGVISEFDSASLFKVDGKSVTTTTETRFENGNESRLANGVMVKVEGTLSSGDVIQATEIKFEAYPKVEIEGEITALENGMFSLADMVVKYNSRTEFEKGKPSDLAVGVSIKVEGRKEDANTVLAEEIKFLKSDAGRTVEVEGRISRFESVTSFAVGSRNITTDSNTVFKNGQASDLKQNVKVEIKGVLQANNVLLAQEVKFDD